MYQLLDRTTILGTAIELYDIGDGWRELAVFRKGDSGEFYRLQAKDVLEFGEQNVRFVVTPNTASGFYDPGRRPVATS